MVDEGNTKSKYRTDCIDMLCMLSMYRCQEME